MNVPQPFPGGTASAWGAVQPILSTADCYGTHLLPQQVGGRNLENAFKYIEQKPAVSVQSDAPCDLENTQPYHSGGLRYLAPGCLAERQTLWIKCSTL